jgi:hypothetical protein
MRRAWIMGASRKIVLCASGAGGVVRFAAVGIWANGAVEFFDFGQGRSAAAAGSAKSGAHVA